MTNAGKVVTDLTVAEFLKTADKRTRKYKMIKKFVDELGTNMSQDVEILWDYILDLD